jgi:spermidine synthase
VLAAGILGAKAARVKAYDRVDVVTARCRAVSRRSGWSFGAVCATAGAMKRWTTLARATTPDGSALTLNEHDGEYVLRVNGRELMSNMRHASELRLGELGGLAAKGPRPRILIGGLGLGFTLRGALAKAPRDAEVVVAELMPEVVEWNRNTAWPLAHDVMADPRTQVVIGDVFALIAKADKPFAAILLDADNGTTAMMTAGNKRLYDSAGIGRVKAALAPGGVAVYWSAVAREPELERACQKLGLNVTTEVIRAYGHGGPRHSLTIARRV